MDVIKQRARLVKKLISDIMYVPAEDLEKKSDIVEEMIESKKINGTNENNETSPVEDIHSITVGNAKQVASKRNFDWMTIFVELVAKKVHSFLCSNRM